MLIKNFDNNERHRYYGLRIGDLVKVETYPRGKFLNAEVMDYGFLDNNRVILKFEDGSIDGWVAEWCIITTKVEDR